MSSLSEQIDALLALNAKGAISHPVPGLAVELLERAATSLRAIPPGGVKPSREQIDEWLIANCGTGIPHGNATDAPSMHGLAYVLRQIEATDSYRPNIGQTNAATSALRLALDHFATQALSFSAQEPVAWLHKLTGILRTDKPSAAMGLQDDYTALYAYPHSDVAIMEGLVERLFQAMMPFTTGTAFRELRVALTAALEPPHA